MAKYKSGIHTRLQILIDKTGGYDPLFHAQCLSDKLSITIDDAIALVGLTSDRDKLNKYIEMIKNKGCSVNDIIKIHRIGVQNSFNKLCYMTSMLNSKSSIEKWR